MIIISGVEVPWEGKGVDPAGVTGGKERGVHGQDVHLQVIPLLYRMLTKQLEYSSLKEYYYFECLNFLAFPALKILIKLTKSFHKLLNILSIVKRNGPAFSEKVSESKMNLEDVSIVATDQDGT